MNTRSLMGGAALAALLILPSLTGHAATKHTPPAPPAPAAAPAPPAAPADPNWVRWPVKSYATTALKLKDVVGTLTIDVTASGPMTAEVSGPRERINEIKITTDGNRLVIDGGDGGDSNSVWDWKNWFNFSDDESRKPDNLFVRVSVPRGADVNVEDLVGNAAIGDTRGVLHFAAAATTATIGRVGEAHIDLGGAGKVSVAQVDGMLHLDVGGSGKIAVGPTQGVDADIAGSGDANFGPIEGGLKLDIAGSGDVTAPRVNGPVHVEIAGSGSVKIADGTADPLHVEIMGAGDFTFGGVAVDPHVEAVGSGTIKLKSYKGKLDNEGMANVEIGDQ